MKKAAERERNRWKYNSGWKKKNNNWDEECEPKSRWKSATNWGKEECDDDDWEQKYIKFEIQDEKN